jgi:hypothetical protein
MSFTRISSYKQKLAAAAAAVGAEEVEVEAASTRVFVRCSTRTPAILRLFRIFLSPSRKIMGWCLDYATTNSKSTILPSEVIQSEIGR